MKFLILCLKINIIIFSFSDGSTGYSPTTTPEVGSHHLLTDMDTDSKPTSNSPTTKLESKPFRGFDITSLMRKDEDSKPSLRFPTALNDDTRTNSPLSGGRGGLSGTPPGLNPSPYTNLFNSGLYQQYLTQILAAGAGGGGLAAPPINPMLLQAQLAMAASGQHPAAAGLLAASYASHPLFSKQHHSNSHSRYSPYSPQPPPISSSAATSPFSSLAASLPFGVGGGRLLGASPSSPLGCGGPASPPVSPPLSSCSPSQVKSEPDLDNESGGMASPQPNSSSPRHNSSSPHSTSASRQSGERAESASDIKNIEKMINGLDKNKDSRL